MLNITSTTNTLDEALQAVLEFSDESDYSDLSD